MSAGASARSARETLVEARPRLLERRGGALLVVLMLTVGALVLPGLGWLIGVVLLWASHGWRRGDKILGTVIGPCAFALPLLARVLLPTGGASAQDSDCADSGFCPPFFEQLWYLSTYVFGEFLVVIGLLLAAYLLVRFRRGGGAPPRTP